MDFVIKEELHFVHCESEANIKTEIDNNIKTESYSDNEDPSIPATTICEFIKTELDPNEMEPNIDNNDELPDPESIYHSMIGAFPPNILCEFEHTTKEDAVPSPTTASIRRCAVCGNLSKGHPKPRGKYCQLPLLVSDEEVQKISKTKSAEAKERNRERRNIRERDKNRTKLRMLGKNIEKERKKDIAKARLGVYGDGPQIPITTDFLALNPKIYRKILPKLPST